MLQEKEDFFSGCNKIMGTLTKFLLLLNNNRGGVRGVKREGEKIIHNIPSPAFFFLSQKTLCKGLPCVCVRC